MATGSTHAADSAAMQADILAAFPLDGRAVCYATLALASRACEDAGPIVGRLVDEGIVVAIFDGGMTTYTRAVH